MSRKKHVRYSKRLGEEICRELARGKTLTAICSTEDMPSTDTVYEWCKKHEEFQVLYDFAREFQVERWGDEIVDIADDSEGDVRYDGDGNMAWDYDHISRSRLRVDTRKWVMARRLPKKWGDRQQLAHTDGEGKPLAVNLIIGEKQVVSND